MIDDFGQSEARITWSIPLDEESEKFRIYHFGSRKLFVLEIEEYITTSMDFCGGINGVRIISKLFSPFRYYFYPFPKNDVKEFYGCSREF